jgi:hypothetical protein
MSPAAALTLQLDFPETSAARVSLMDLCKRL